VDYQGAEAFFEVETPANYTLHGKGHLRGLPGAEDAGSAA
jgi:hypothetical protein